VQWNAARVNASIQMEFQGSRIQPALFIRNADDLRLMQMKIRKKEKRDGRQRERDAQVLELAVAELARRISQHIVNELKAVRPMLGAPEMENAMRSQLTIREEAMADDLIALSKEYHAARVALARLQHVSGSGAKDTAGFDAELETFAEPLRQRMSQLSRRIVEARAASPEELAHKASVVLDWIDEDQGDMADRLGASLCRDIMQAFPLPPAKPQKPDRE
jgi:hypothetical protein